MAWIEIFRAGKHTSSNGVTATYGVDFIQAVADNYNANVGTHLAPLTLGHKPKSGDPAQAWFKSLRVNGDILEGELQDVNPDFSTTQYKKVSSSFFLPDSPSNPTPGYPNLRHVAALGAETPAVAGLRNIEFSEDSTGVVEFSDGLSTQVGLFRSIREWIVSKFGTEEADKAVPAAEVEWLNTLDVIEQIDDAVEQTTGTDSTAAPMEAAVEDDQAEGAAVAEGDGAAASTAATTITTTTTITTSAASSAATADSSPDSAAPAADFTADPANGTADFAAREAALVAREAEFAAREAAIQDAECASFCEGLVSAGQLRPCDKDAAKNILASLYKTEGSVDFAESALPVADAFKQFLKNLPKVVEFGEVAAEDYAPTNNVADFVAAPGYEVDESGSALRAAIAKFADANGLTFAEAALRYTQR